MVSAELRKLVVAHKPRIRHVIDKMAEWMGYTLLRLPLYHCELNAIEFTWAEVNLNTNFEVNEVGELLAEALSHLILYIYWWIYFQNEFTIHPSQLFFSNPSWKTKYYSGVRPYWIFSPAFVQFLLLPTIFP